MNWDIQSQVKNVINLILTILIGIFVALLPQSHLYLIGIIVAGLLEVIILLFIKSKEEKYYDKCMKSREKMEDLDRKLEEKSKEVTYSTKMKKLNDKGKRYNKAILGGSPGSLESSYAILNTNFEKRK